jgi:lipoprotein-anchoring transpeptidase ErfK/SrfK
MAYRKVNGMARRYDADRRVIEKVLAGKGAFKPRHPDAGHHVEADISRQVLALIDGGDVVATYHTSTGAPATPTIIGSFRVYMKTPGTNAKGMVHSSYFIRGYAIHGYYDVPAFNASHGCLRVPIPDAWRIFNWIRPGDRVITYR